MKKILVLILAATLAFSLLAGCESSTGTETPDAGANAVSPAATQFKGKDLNKDSIRIAYVGTTMAGQLHLLCEQAMEQWARSYPNLELVFFDPALNLTTQITMIGEAVTQGFDAIMLEALDMSAVTTAVNEAEDAGIPVITIAADTYALHTLHLQLSAYGMGQIAAKAFADALGGAGNIVLFDYPYEILESAPFGAGFTDYLADYPDMKLIEHLHLDATTFSQEGNFTMASDVLTKHDKVDAFYVPGDDLAMGIVQAIGAAGRGSEGILVWGSECMPIGIDAIREGTLYGTCFPDRYTMFYTAFAYALHFIQSGMNTRSLGLTETPVITINAQAVTAENVDRIAPLTRWEGY